MTMDASSYKEPSWARPPPPENKWSLIEIKGGIEVSTHDLTSCSCTVLGRASDMVDITTAHESCSRRHARIAFDQHGRPWLRDLGSAHGTCVNKKRLPPQACGKLESNSNQKGSRGVQIFPGDVVQFGASTRVYCLEGPPEFERGAVMARQDAAAAAAGTTAVSSTTAQQVPVNSDKSENDDNAGISWGIDMDDPAEEQPTNRPAHESIDLDPSKIPPKHLKAFERLRAKQYKLENLQQESERIQRKGLVQELTDGQTAQLQRNTERITKLQEEIEEAERELMDRINPNNNTVKVSTGRRKHHEEEDDDVDDFYDRTIDHNRDTGGEGETEASLTGKWKSLVDELQQHGARVASCNDTVRKLQEQLLHTPEDDAFFVQNDLNLAEDVYKKALAEKSEMKKKLDETERLLGIVNDKLVFDRSTKYVGLPLSSMPPSGATVIPALSIKRSEREVGPNSMLPPPAPAVPSKESSFMPQPRIPENMFMPPPPAAEKSSMPPPSFGPEPMGPKKAALDNLMPTPKRPRTIGPAAKPEGSSLNEPLDMQPPSGKKTTKIPSSHQAMGTLSGLSFSSSSESDSSKSKKETKKKLVPTADPKRDEWRAPEGQDGSGITKLNAKFAGRY